MNERITIATPDGSFRAYVAYPAASEAQAASIVVIQEIFGINADVRATCDELAERGYIAIAPDLFWRLQPGVDMTDQTQEEWKKAFALYKAFDIEKGVADIAATLATARTLHGANGKAGVMGHCLGGLMSYLTAVRSKPDAAVAYYGGRTQEYIGELGQLACPLMMHLAGEDEYMAASARVAIVSAVKGNRLVEVHTYEGQNHAFARRGGTHYNAEAAQLADQRTYDFFASHL